MAIHPEFAEAGAAIQAQLQQVLQAEKDHLEHIVALKLQLANAEKIKLSLRTRAENLTKAIAVMQGREPTKRGGFWGRQGWIKPKLPIVPQVPDQASVNDPAAPRVFVEVQLSEEEKSTLSPREQALLKRDG